MHRTDPEVAAHAIIAATLGFRASLEVTEHPRAKALCSQLLPWLEQLGIGSQIEVLHREILETSHGDLPPDSQSEALWRGEAAVFLGWAIERFEKPDPSSLIDPRKLVTNLHLLQPTAGDILVTDKLRSKIEIEDYCVFCLTVRHQIRVSRLQAASRAMFGTIHRETLDSLGLSDAFSRTKGLEAEAAELASREPSLQGLYIARAMAAEWLLGADEGPD